MNFEAQPSGGSSTYRVVAANTDNAAVIKAMPGKVLGYEIANKSAAVLYVKLYDKATAPSASDTPALTILIKAGDRAFLAPSQQGPQFTTGIGIRIVTGAADSDNTAPTAGDGIAQIFWA